jgi:hypothetical protein
LMKHDLFGKPLHTFPDHALVSRFIIFQPGWRRRNHLPGAVFAALNQTALIIGRGANLMEQDDDRT